MARPSTELEPAESTEIVPWREELRAQGGALTAFLPDEVTRKRFLRVVAQAVERNPDLLDCTPESIASAAVEAAMYGLEPSGAAGGAHLVPFNEQIGKTGRYVKKAKLIVDYRGQLQLARDSEKVEDAYAIIVRQKDAFRYDAANGVIEHFPDLEAPASPNPEDPANPMTFVYGVLVFASGYRRVEVMSKAQVDAVRAMSRAANAPAWTGSYLEMAKKTVMHRLLKTAPLRPGARSILERGDPDIVFEPTRATVEPMPSRAPLADRLRQRRLGTSVTEEAAACSHPEAGLEARADGVYCGSCGELVAQRAEEAAEPAEAATAAPKPKARGRKPKAPAKPGDDGYGTARAHAVAAERGLDHAAVHRIAADVLRVAEDELEGFSVKDLSEEQWAEVIAAIDEAPKPVDAEDDSNDAVLEWVGQKALEAGVAPDENGQPWTAADSQAAAMFDDDADHLSIYQWLEYGIRVAAQNPLP